jgi:type VI secretion system secreted protein Hcp
MAVEMFFRVDGVPGGSHNYSHKGWSDLLSWRWNLDRPVGTSHAIAAPPNEISLVKAVGMDSTELMRLFAEGKPVKFAEIDIVPVVGKRDAQQKYLGITMHDVMIKSIDIGGSLDESVFKEKITLRFNKVKFEYHQYSDASASGGAPSLTDYAFDWDLLANPAS